MKDGTYESKGWADGCAYSNSKMGDTLMTRAIAYELSKTPERDIVINSVSLFIYLFNERLLNDSHNEIPSFL